VRSLVGKYNPTKQKAFQRARHDTTRGENTVKPRAAAWLIMLALTFAIPIGAGTVHAKSMTGDAAAAMRARHDTMRDQLSDNHFEQPICVSSDFKDERISGELSGVIEHPFVTATAAFKSAGNWCDIMMLHLNVKYCRASENGSDQILTVFVGKKYHQPLESAYRGEYGYRVLHDRPDYFKVALTSDSGPLQTRNYHVLLEAVPADPGQTFVHFTYSYDFGALARIAKSVYFHTVGRKKVGFTVVDNGPDGEPVYIGGVRGALERNIMRYYLAMKAYLGALSVPPQERLEKRLQDWFALTECYPLQLRELDKNEYMRMKRQEHERLKTR
jgi:hypothetical protein